MQSKFTFGIDEVGRGCVAGPLVVCGVLDSKTLDSYPILNDSKKLTPKRRDTICLELKKQERFFVQSCPAKTIDSLGMAQALKLTFWNLSKNISYFYPNSFCLIDGNLDFGIKNSKTVIKGDTKHKSIMAASIIAKVYRDDLMKRESVRFPEFEFESHKGYLSRRHISLIKANDISYIHRKSFLRNYL